MRIVVASLNPVKTHAVSAGFASMFPGEAIDLVQVSVCSGVSDQPVTDDETLRGALGRVQAAAVVSPQADFWVGVEGGIQEEDGEMLAFAWVVILSPRFIGKGRTASFVLPPRVGELNPRGHGAWSGRRYCIRAHQFETGKWRGGAFNR